VRKALLAIALLSIHPLPAQPTLSNDNVIKATKAGFSAEFIIATINRSPGAYDISADGLAALKNAGVSGEVVSAVVSKATAVTATPVAGHPANKPRVFLEARSHSDLWNGNRNQSMEMSKDFGRDCPDIQISVNRTLADYTGRRSDRAQPGDAGVYIKQLLSMEALSPAGQANKQQIHRHTAEWI
jgi:hypothetical protein